MLFFVQGSSKCVNESGALCPSLDNPTQALDVLQEAVNAQDLTIGEDIYLALNVAANEFYDVVQYQLFYISCDKIQITVAGTNQQSGIKINYTFLIKYKYSSV